MHNTLHCTPVLSWYQSLIQVLGSAEKPSLPKKVVAEHPVIVAVEIPVAPVVPVSVKFESIVPGREELKKELRKELEVELRGKKYGKEGFRVHWETAEQIQLKQWLCRETIEGKVPEYMTKFAGHVSRYITRTYMTCKLCHVVRYFALTCLST